MIITRRIWPLVLTFLLVSATPSPLLTLLQPVSGIDPEVLRLTTLSTAVGALVVLLLWRPLPHPAVARSGLLRPLALAGLAAAGAMALLWAVTLPAAGRWPVLDPATLPAPLAVVLIVQVLGALAEEVGWRGVVQPVLETKLRPVTAWLVTGLLFGLGHVYVLAAGVAGVAVFGAFLVSAVALSVVLGVLTTGRSFAGRVVVATAGHWLVNVGLLVFFSDGDESLGWVAATAVVMAVVAATALLVCSCRRRLASV